MDHNLGQWLRETLTVDQVSSLQAAGLMAAVPGLVLSLMFIGWANEVIYDKNQHFIIKVTFLVFAIGFLLTMLTLLLLAHFSLV